MLENEYLRAMRANKFSAHMPVYVASGLLTYGADEGEHSSLVLAALPLNSTIQTLLYKAGPLHRWQY